MTLIASRYKIDFETHKIFDLKGNSDSSITKVEPRVLQVLKILVDNSPNVVTREQLIDEVWNNYGGADDALNQAISHLRKYLGDNDRNNRLIETVVKKGYRFNGPVAQEHNSPKIKKRHETMSGTHWIIIILLILTFLSYVIWMLQEKEAPAPMPDVIMFRW